MTLSLHRSREAAAARSLKHPWTLGFGWAVVPLLALCAVRPAAGADVAASGTFWDLGKDADARRAAFSPDGRTLALYDLNAHSITLWEVATKKRVATVRKDGWEPSGEFLFAPDGKSLLARGTRFEPKGGGVLRKDAVVVWELKGYEEQSAADLEAPGVGGLAAFTADGKALVVAAPAPQGVGALGAIAYDPATGKKLKSFDPDATERGPVSALAISPDGKTLALGAEDRTIFIFDIEKGKARHKIEPVQPLGRDDSTAYFKDVFAIAFSADGKRLFSSGPNAHVEVWDPATGKNVDFLQPGAFIGGIKALVPSPDGKTLAIDGASCRGRPALELWDLNAGGLRADFMARPQVDILRPKIDNFPAGGAVFSPDSKVLLTFSDGGPLQFWDVPQDKPKNLKPAEPPQERKRPGGS
jgi:WD40 repeat protein